jgi:hypothetical protein
MATVNATPPDTRGKNSRHRRDPDIGVYRLAVILASAALASSSAWRCVAAIEMK